MRPDDRDEDAGLDISRSRLSFLGPEFLTWAYFHIEMNDGCAEIDFRGASNRKEMSTARITIGSRITIKPLSMKELCVTVTSPMLDDSGEVLQAIHSGGLVFILALQAEIDDIKYDFTLNAIDAAISQVKIQLPFADEPEEFIPGQERESKVTLSEEETFFLRMASIEEIENIVEKLYHTFLLARLATDYVPRQLGEIQRHVVSRLQERVNVESSTKYPSRELVPTQFI